MYLSNLVIENFRCFGDGKKRLELHLEAGLTALVGENDAGKTAIIDALRFALGTSDQEWYRLEDSDFHREAREIRIVCMFEGLNSEDKRIFLDHLTYGDNSKAEPVLFVNWMAKNTSTRNRGRSYKQIDIQSGKNGDGPKYETVVRDQFLRSTYLRPLRDADQLLSAGRGSRLAQILQHSELVKSGADAFDLTLPLSKQNLSVKAISNLINSMLEQQSGIAAATKEINTKLKSLTLINDALESRIDVGGGGMTDELRVRELLEKLDVSLGGLGKSGLGSDNLLFVACELLLLAQEKAGNKLLLIEEPEAHLHPQRQLQLMRFLQKQAMDEKIQIIITTHSPNLASALNIENLVVIRDQRAFPLSRGKTKLEVSDHRFLERFLDVTKANLFFARGVLIVEGDAEAILLPVIAKILGLDFTKNGISIVNVGGVGLRRYARIFQRADVKEGDTDKYFPVRVACLADMDVMPDCAPVIIGKIGIGAEWPKLGRRRWYAKRDIGTELELEAERAVKLSHASGQSVKTFVSDEWTLEYDLALGSKAGNGVWNLGMSEDLFVAACLASEDSSIVAGKTTLAELEASALGELAELRKGVVAKDGCALEEVLATHIYAKFAKDGVSKAVAAQYLADRLEEKHCKNEINAANFRARLPKYITDAIDYVSGV